MGLDHVVVTSVDRDDLADGGSAHWAAVVRTLKTDEPARTVEVLTPDFNGIADQIDRVADEKPDVYNHNVETVPGSIRRSVRRRSSNARRAPRPGEATPPRDDDEIGPHARAGETDPEVVELFRPSAAPAWTSSRWGSTCVPRREPPGREYATPERFAALQEAGEKLGFRHVFAGRSCDRATGPESF